MIRFSMALAILLPAGAMAQAPAPPPAAARPAVTPIPGVSPAGMAVVGKYRGAGDPELPPLVRQQRQIHQQLIAATLATAIDPDHVATLLKQDEAAQAAVRAHLNDQMIEALHELPEADRAPFLRSLIKPAAAAPR